MTTCPSASVVLRGGIRRGPLRALPVLVRHGLRQSRLGQIGLILGFWWLGQSLAHLARVPLPGALIGLTLLLLTLATGRISLLSARRGAQCFLADMLLFFVPAVLAVMEHGEFLGWLGVKVLVVVLGGTLAVMTVTALTVEACQSWIQARRVGPHATDAPVTGQESAAGGQQGDAP